MMRGQGVHRPECGRAFFFFFSDFLIWIIFKVFIESVTILPLFNFLNLFLIEGYLLYNIVLVSAIHQNESALSIHMSPPS